MLLMVSCSSAKIFFSDAYINMFPICTIGDAPLLVFGDICVIDPQQAGLLHDDGRLARSRWP
jgi:hypothetical protein